MKALITGATSGIGMCMAQQLSRMGWELILTGRNTQKLEELRDTLGRTEIITADLSKKEDAFRVYEFSRDKNVDMLVNNAGYGIFGRFDETDLNDELDMLGLNIVSLHILMNLSLRNYIMTHYTNMLLMNNLLSFLSVKKISTMLAYSVLCWQL